MSSRKEMPDVLGDILGGVRSYPIPPELISSPPPEAKTPAADAVIPTAPAPATPALATPPTPREWEYREVVFRDYRGWRARIVNGRELGDWKTSPTIVEYLEQAGQDGWELVSVSDRYNNQKEAYFKRPKR
jgi:hypothetical protein